MTFADLQGEFDRELIGELIYRRVSILTERYLRRRDPKVYARGSHDYRDGLEDVVNDFVLQVLIGERQIDYIMTTAVSLESFDALTNRHLRRFLARTRVRTVVDNLIDRSVVILRSEPFASRGHGSDEIFFLGAPVEALAQPARAELQMAVTLAQRVPKILGHAEVRAPRIYERDGLKAILMILVSTVSAPVRRSDLQDFFGDLLTPWGVALLEATEEVDPPARALTPSEMAVVEETSRTMFENLTDEGRLIFQYKYANLPDRALAQAVGLSRQSTAPRKKAVFEQIAGLLDRLDHHLQEGALMRLNELIAATGVDTG